MKIAPEYFDDLRDFEWDEGNSSKNWSKHDVSQIESEQVFFNRPILVAAAGKSENDNIRHFALGKTNQERLLTIVFTIRGHSLRIISARPMSRKERTRYGKT